MPIYDIHCKTCGKKAEVLLLTRDETLACPHCGSIDTSRLMSPTSSLTGREGQNFPGARDTACCGSTPSQAGCAGPGSCCGKMR